MARKIEWNTPGNYSLGDPLSAMQGAQQLIQGSLAQAQKTVTDLDKAHKDANASKLMEVMQMYPTTADFNSPIAQEHMAETLAGFGNSIDRKAAFKAGQDYLNGILKREADTQKMQQDQLEFNTVQTARKINDLQLMGYVDEAKAVNDAAREQGINAWFDAHGKFANYTKQQVDINAAKGRLIDDQAQQVGRQATAYMLAGQKEEALKLLANNPLATQYANQYYAETQGQILSNDGKTIANQNAYNQGQIVANQARVSNQATNDLFGGGMPDVTNPPASASKNYAENSKRFNNPNMRQTLQQFGGVIDSASKEHGVPTELIGAVIAVESTGVHGSKSEANARGLMQIIPSTWKGLTKGTKYEGMPHTQMTPEANIEMGTKYLGQLLKKYGGDAEKAFAAYNAGPGNVDKWIALGNASGKSWKSHMNFKQTQDYLVRLQDVRLYMNEVAQKSQGRTLADGTPVTLNTNGTYSVRKDSDIKPENQPENVVAAERMLIKAEVTKNFSKNTNFFPSKKTKSDFYKEVKTGDSFWRQEGPSSSKALDIVDAVVADKAVPNWGKVHPDRQGIVLENALKGFFPSQIANTLFIRGDNRKEVIRRMTEAVNAEVLLQESARNTQIRALIDTKAAGLVKRFGMTREQAFMSLGLDALGNPREGVDNPFYDSN